MFPQTVADIRSAEFEYAASATFTFAELGVRANAHLDPEPDRARARTDTGLSFRTRSTSRVVPASVQPQCAPERIEELVATASHPGAYGRTKNWIFRVKLLSVSTVAFLSVHP